jgi:hypothetical protein
MCTTYVPTVISFGTTASLKRRGGGRSDISNVLLFCWFELVLYLNPVAKFPEPIESPGHFVGFADNVAHGLAFRILKNDLSNVLHRHVVRSATDAAHRNKRVTFKSNIRETLDRLDSRPSAVIAKESHCKQRSRKTNDGISNRAGHRAVYILTRKTVTIKDLKYMLYVMKVLILISPNYMKLSRLKIRVIPSLYYK